MNYDVIIIGAGVSGSAVARELSRFRGKIAVFEKEMDLCEGTTKANSGICHSGFDAKTGTLKARLNVEGNQMMEQLSKDLDFPFIRNGSLVVALKGDSMEQLVQLQKQGTKNDVQGLEVLTREQVREMEPHISDEVIGALYAPTGGVVCPFGLNLALAENANQNVVEFSFDTAVEKIEPCDGMWKIETNKGVFYTKSIVNAAGIYADVFHNMES